ncbi:uncharacterized protein LOC121680702 isoform X1 [Alosa sapidissima]|uniref:uncharacterized protein LOC121680702 isoform X1 n=1 Tax=Alosa sapidissima TaxID=34773 RepID=UPI001C08C9FF|nr:uncharacterized protein LOC121680702 isoform X1 [Alosa sapidissima]
MASRDNLFASLGFRPVVCTAGLTATAVGAVFLFSRWRKETAEIGTQTDWETADAGTQAGWETAEASTQAGWETADAGTQAKWETVEAGIQAECQRAEAGVQAVQETAVSATQAVWETAEVGTQPDWTDGFILVDTVAPQVVTLDGVDGQLQPSGWDVQTLLRYTMVYRSSTLFFCGPVMVGERRCSGETAEGSLRTQFWFTADENCVLDAEGNRDTYTTIDAATIIEWRCGEVVRAVSHHKQESKLSVLMDGVPVIQISKTYKRVTLSANGSLVSSERSETSSVPAPVVPDPSADGADGPADASGPTDPPGADASAAAAADDTQSSAQGSEDSCLLPEAREVPLIFNFFQSKSLEDFSTRLTALRQAFTILLSDDQQCNYASVAVRMILRNLATLNGRDADLFQRAFDDLVAYVQNSENALSIQVELLEARIHHINVLDIVFELVLFGMFDVAQRQLVPRVQGGFLDRLLAVVHAFLPFEACSPAAHQYWQMLQAEVRAFLEEVFSLDLSVYSRLQALADGLFSCLEQCYLLQFSWGLPVPS